MIVAVAPLKSMNKTIRVLVMALCMTMHVGCKTEIGGTNGAGSVDPDVRYFPHGQEFKISPATDPGVDADNGDSLHRGSLEKMPDEKTNAISSPGDDAG